MSAALERLKQHDAQQELPVSQTGTVMEVLDSLRAAVEAQNSRLAVLADRQQKLASYVKAMDEETNRQNAAMELRLLQSITAASVPASNDSSTHERTRSELHEIGQTMSSLASAIDGKQIGAAVSTLNSAAIRIERTTAWSSEQASGFAAKYDEALNVAGRTIHRARDEAVKAIRETASGAAGTAAEHVEAATGRLDAARQSAERLVEVAERLQKPLGWAAAARMGLALLPVTVALLMAVQTIWTLVVGIQWVLAQDWALWLEITAGIGLTGLVAGAGFGLWRMTVWVKAALDEAAKRLGGNSR